MPTHRREHEVMYMTLGSRAGRRQNPSMKDHPVPTVQLPLSSDNRVHNWLYECAQGKRRRESSESAQKKKYELSVLINRT